MQKFPTSLLEATRYFADEKRCIDTVASLRWPNGTPICPKCGIAEGERKHYWLDAQKRWKCYACRKQFSVKVNSIFEDSAVSLDKWLIALWMLCNCKNGISSYEIARDLKLTQKSAWFILQRLRTVLQTQTVEKAGGENGGPVEVDETFVGGSPKNKHFGERMKTAKTIKDQNGVMVSNPNFEENRGRSSRKTPVFGMIDREARRVRACVIPGIQRKVLQDLILENVSKGSTIYSDGLREYMGLGAMGFVHDTVNHIEEYVRGEVHTNGIENFWSLLKRSLRGTYVAVEPFHLDRYVTEQVFRFNNRTTKDNPLNDGDRFALALSQISGKRLTFAELTGKVPPSA
jgi:transposase-like protein